MGRFPLLWIASTIAVALIASVFGRAEDRCVAAFEAISIGAAVDIRCGYIFDPLIAAGFACAAGFASLEGSAFDAIIGAGATSASLMAVWLATRGRGLGLGDVKLAAVMGAGLGPTPGVVALALAFVIGGAVGTLLLVLGKAGPGTPIRFGPYLLAGILSVLSYHQLNTGVIPWP